MPQNHSSSVHGNHFLPRCQFGQLLLLIFVVVGPFTCSSSHNRRKLIQLVLIMTSGELIQNGTTKVTEKTGIEISS